MKVGKQILKHFHRRSYKILKEKNYVLESSKLKKDLNIVLFSDIHYQEKYNYQKLREIIRYVFEERPDYVLIPGDLIDDSRLDFKFQNHILEFIHAIANYVPVKISLGNHEEMTRNDGNGKNKKWKHYRNDLFLEQLRTISNVTLFDDCVENQNEDKVSFGGMTLPIEHFEKKHEAESDLVEVLEEESKQNVIESMNEENYRILLFHSPANLFKKKVLERNSLYENVDLVVSGHMHDGLVPTFITKWFKTRGFISPTKKIFPKFVRGHICYQTMDGIISTGIQKFNFPFCDKILKPEITKIIVKKR